MAEFGVSVLPHARGRSFGARLFDHAILHARNRGVETLFIHALSENTAMLRSRARPAPKSSATAASSEAWLKLPPETIGSRFDEVVGQHAAEIDFQMQAAAHRVQKMLGAVEAREPMRARTSRRRQRMTADRRPTPRRLASA